ncbi:MAG: hypothetical protein EZS28_015091 [Streblomastix strix]|uniref:Uncharacterized protein n=1 Tax=Streblomastix strix TaxID=222440 RepID=A0A5J4W3Y7_9EUKA|nr:MAG: hypothetical protein EZS28_015091 [Streblomastix strix]
MNSDELLNNLGTLAQSGILRFPEATTSNEFSSQDLIDQLDVKLYSAFLVANKVEIRDISNEFSEFLDFTIQLRIEEDTKDKSRHRDPQRKKKIIDGNTNDNDEFNFEIPDFRAKIALNDGTRPGSKNSSNYDIF